MRSSCLFPNPHIEAIERLVVGMGAPNLQSSLWSPCLPHVATPIRYHTGLSRLVSTRPLTPPLVRCALHPTRAPRVGRTPDKSPSAAPIHTASARILSAERPPGHILRKAGGAPRRPDTRQSAGRRSCTGTRGRAASADARTPGRSPAHRKSRTSTARTAGSGPPVPHRERRQCAPPYLHPRRRIS